MKKFVIFLSKGNASILEVECELVSSLDDVSVMSLPAGEFKMKISSPNSLLQKRVVGKDTFLDPVIYYSHSIYDSVEQALCVAKKDVRDSLIRDYFKKHFILNEEEADALIKTIEVLYL